MISLRRKILRTLKKVHPDVNPKPDAENKTRLLIAMLPMADEIEQTRRITLEQARKLSSAYKGR